jgi:hypothetical protein
LKGQRVQQGSDREQLLCVEGKIFVCVNKKIKVDEITLHLYFVWKIQAGLVGNLALTLSA